VSTLHPLAHTRSLVRPVPWLLHDLPVVPHVDSLCSSCSDGSPSLSGHAAVDAFAKGLSDLEEVATYIGEVFEAALEAHDAK
jgi:hypothetical protein